MKKFEKLGKSLSKDEQKKIMGGRIVPQSGWTLSGSQCYCDFTYMREDGGFTSYCNVPCASTCCSSSGYPCSYQV